MIPLEQGSVFRLIYYSWFSILNQWSQSLWNRAVSSDDLFLNVSQGLKTSQSLWNRAVSSDCSGILKPCGTRLTRAISQLFPRLRELGLDLIKCCTNFNILFTYQAVENRGDFTRVFRFY